MLNLEIIIICKNMRRNVKYANICKICLYILNILFRCNSGCAKKICQISNIRALVTRYN